MNQGSYKHCRPFSSFYFPYGFQETCEVGNLLHLKYKSRQYVPLKRVTVYKVVKAKCLNISSSCCDI